jgi:hypothetical protein
MHYSCRGYAENANYNYQMLDSDYYFVDDFAFSTAKYRTKRKIAILRIP